jgi:hypothetical protein
MNDTFYENLNEESEPAKPSVSEKVSADILTAVFQKMSPDEKMSFMKSMIEAI